MFSASPFYRSSPYSSNYYPYGQSGCSPLGYYPSPYASRVAEEHRHNARLQAIERERELQRQRLLAQRRDERARQYIVDTYDTDTAVADDIAYDYGFGRYLNPYASREQARPRRTSTSKHSIPMQSPSPSKDPQPEPVNMSPPAEIQEAPSSLRPSDSQSPISSFQRQPSPSPSEQSSDESSSELNQADLVQKSLGTIQTLQQKFEGLKTTFTWPSHIDFDLDGEVISVSTDSSSEPRLTPPKLAYTIRNTPLHAYNESLNRLLVQLDAVQSWGEQEVRERRKRVVSIVEAEAVRVERRWKAVWEGKGINAEEDEVIDIVTETGKDDEGYGGKEQQ
ncbi:uncharacterized protein BT62DRAFT_1048578 [Guyanagaster necrorhizus]|uniref:BAG domain-containing protein n=1 Tax=Guyanagaster necrorhizus TaxID=856835 RepID=A0A9P7VYI7_9AGAR|nr:uncharacterized protein BT62DRAFT_1048578 [Guyanagaster necrorhizus MCA 3950]KAG7449548.1 hypothetical protein BT62DRAFT_1048578 [Guyanagaster necrorhizus MCA 3950]